MIKFNLKDSSLYYLNTSRYQNSLVSDKYGKYFGWTKDEPSLPTYYTYTHLGQIDDEAERNLILLESSAIIPANVLSWVSQNSRMFHRIYTHNTTLLHKHSNCRWIPGGGIWIGGEFGGGEIKIYDKSKLCSFVSSDKTMCNLHILRLESAKYVQHNISQVDVIGALAKGFQPAIECLKDYMFSVIFENNVDELYFTEKILNCFATGTVPIYIGAKRITEVFNGDGILQFSNPMELVNILRTITPDDYTSRLPAIRENLELSKQFECIEDYMWLNYIKDNK